MQNNKPSYDELFNENKLLKQQLAILSANCSEKERAELVVKLNEYVEELKQTFETVKRQKQELEQYKLRFELLEENISDVIWMMNMNEEFVYVSASASAMYGYSQEELLNLDISDIHTIGSFRAQKAAFSKSIAL